MRKHGHGRAENRVVMVSEQLSLLDAAEGWTGLKSVVCVEATAATYRSLAEWQRAAG
ncbi:MAG: hypothetical protein V4714_14930 [Bacteroidota bacterium]